MRAENPLEYLRHINKWAMETEEVDDMWILAYVSYDLKEVEVAHSYSIPEGLHMACFWDMDKDDDASILIYGSPDRLIPTNEKSDFLYICDIKELIYPDPELDNEIIMPPNIQITFNDGLKLQLDPVNSLVLPKFS